MKTRSTRNILFLSMCGLLACGSMSALDGCKRPEKAPPPKRISRLPDPPQVRDVSLARPKTMNVGDSVSIVLDAYGGQIPIDWELTGLPQSWQRTTGDDGRFYILSGRLPMGSSKSNISLGISVRDGNGRQSELLPIEIEVLPKVYDFQPTLISTSADKRTREYSVRLRELPDWDPGFDGTLEIWVDTVGLEGPADSLRLFIPDETDLDLTQTIEGDAPTVSGNAEPGETFHLVSPIHHQAIEGTQLRLSIQSATNPDFRVFKVRVTAH